MSWLGQRNTTRAAAHPLIDQLRHRRLRMGLSQRGAADRCGMQQSAWARIEAGRQCTLLTLEAMARAVGLRLVLLTTAEAEALERQRAKKPRGR